MCAYLICDSGSTKSQWMVINGKEIELDTTLGPFNPHIHNSPELSLLCSQIAERTTSLELERVEFYGAGITPDKKDEVAQIISQQWPNSEVVINSDMVLAARVTSGNLSAWVAIIGTGSNLCYFNGTDISYTQPSLGWFWGDEGSGRKMVMEVLKAFSREMFSTELMGSLASRLKCSPNEMASLLLKSVGSITPIEEAAQSLADIWDDDEMVKLSEGVIGTFVKRVIHCVGQRPDIVHFSGSIAYFHQDFIKRELAKRGIECGSFIRFPLRELSKRYVTVNE